MHAVEYSILIHICHYCLISQQFLPMEERVRDKAGSFKGRKQQVQRYTNKIVVHVFNNVFVITCLAVVAALVQLFRYETV